MTTIDPNLLIIIVLLVISEALAFMPRVESSSIIQLFIAGWKFLFFKDPKGKEEPKQWHR